MSDPRLLLLSPDDNVCAATRTLEAGEEVPFDGGTLRVACEVPVGHKVCVRQIAEGAKVIKYGAPIGSATRRIEPGEHVHLHNLESDYMPPAGRGEGGDDGAHR